MKYDKFTGVEVAVRLPRLVRVIERWPANRLFRCAGVAELVDARDLKSLGPQGLCGFDSRPPHQNPRWCGWPSWMPGERQP